MTRELHIESYFSLPTDLAAEMRDWPEFVKGEGYAVVLFSEVTVESVDTRFIEEDGGSYVIIGSSSSGQLFDRVTGTVVRALITHSDTLVIHCSFECSGRRLTGGYTEALQLSVLVGCSLGLIVTTIVILLTKKR